MLCANVATGRLAIVRNICIRCAPSAPPLPENAAVAVVGPATTHADGGAAVDVGEEQSRTTIRASLLLMVQMVAVELGSVGT